MGTSLRQGVLGAPENIEVQARLLNYLNGGRLHPAVILSGPANSTKMVVAKNIAKHLACRSKKNTTFCNDCSHCRRIEKEIHPDVLVFRSEEDDTIKIETVRQLCLDMTLTSVECESRVCIIDEFHRMSTPSANAFLKSLEEPGPNRYFWLLTSHIGSLLPTILSRCLVFNFLPESKLSFFSEDEGRVFEERLSQAVQLKSTSPFVKMLDDKDQCRKFILYIQKNARAVQLRDVTSPSFQHVSEFRALSIFDDALVIEGRLRSNANYGLMIENFIRQHFLLAESG